jgi:hypothetical protein
MQEKFRRLQLDKGYFLLLDQSYLLLPFLLGLI